MKKRMSTAVHTMVYGALVAALYAALTIFIAPIATGVIQCRVSEALCVLPYFMPAAVPGLFLGCLLANLLLGAPLLDIIAGSLTTLLAAYLTHLIGKKRLTPWLAPGPAVLLNALIMGYVVMLLYAPELPYALCALYVGIGQVGACYVLGIPVFFAYRRFGGTL